MNGGMIRAAGHGAIAVLAGLLLSTGSARAADLGGNCCVDLEERVAELEATTARKGNRKVSLTIYGWVNKAVLYWNDGFRDNTYFGVDNTNFGTRFGFRGEAKINPTVKAGFSILIDVVSGAGTSSINQSREDLALGGTDSNGNANSGLNSYLDDHAMRMRDANVWIEHTRLGRLTVGHLTSPGHQGIIDLAGIAVASAGAIDLVGGGFAFVNSNSATGALSGATIANNTTGVADFALRVDAVRWDSPSLHGFIIGLSAGEAARTDGRIPAFNPTSGNGPVGLFWAANLRYAAEHHGFRVAAAVGYEESDGDERALGSLTTAQGSFTTAQGSTLGASLSLLHVARGLFVQGQWIRFERPNGTAFGATGVPSTSDDGTLWMIQAGITKNWTGLGNSAFYGEFARGNDLQRTFSPVTVQFTPTGGSQQQAVNGSNEYTMWGLGLVQNIDAAAMEVYLAYRNHSLNRTAETTGANANASVDDIHTVIGGMRIGF